MNTRKKEKILIILILFAVPLLFYLKINSNIDQKKENIKSNIEKSRVHNTETNKIVKRVSLKKQIALYEHIYSKFNTAKIIKRENDEGCFYSLQINAKENRLNEIMKLLDSYGGKIVINSIEYKKENQYSSFFIQLELC
ncbi:hypothetical protein [Peptostreptococcus canis]|uniref:Uncharacterized protein n=1 Tax=Peptostreptococcus canis TaxID=1159213 RepID=A0ABR6TL89_9FIRM|nr:hypothetical protein [Peptostreptococcus canis]MBC2576165.1 hypothetical protein [Peptostreptococcus canis]MBP1998302.1 hypothetical protein [Peptostreptococcus canis]